MSALAEMLFVLHKGNTLECGKSLAEESLCLESI